MNLNMVGKVLDVLNLSFGASDDDGTELIAKAQDFPKETRINS